MDMPNSDTATDISAQLKYLREQVDKLITERAVPRLAEVADQLSEMVGRTEEMARRGYSAARENVDVVSEKVKEQPISAILIAAAAGFLIGRMSR